MGLVGCHHDVISSPDSTFDNGDVDDIVVTRSPGELANSARLVRAHRLDVAACKQASQVSLARSASPSFGQYGRGDDRHDLLSNETHVQGPHSPVAALTGIERTGIVGDPRH